jgi:hypothetical protein
VDAGDVKMPPQAGQMGGIRRHGKRGVRPDRAAMGAIPVRAAAG